MHAERVMGEARRIHPAAGGQAVTGTMLQEIRSLTPPLATVGVGVGLTLSDVQTIVGIIAGVVGIIGTLYTLWLRRLEHKRRMGR